jgi:iron(II)-dependent oxidoreductase
MPANKVAIPGGTFTMGCTAGDTECDEDEHPRHPVTLRSFYLDPTEVTVGAYRKCVEAGRCTAPRTKSDDEYCNWGYGDRDEHPINCVTWEQARAYCGWAGGRLPSEAEWEYAARGGRNDWRYPWGNETASCSRAVMDDGADGCGQDRTWPVGSKPANGFGLYDMAGNVWEWTADCRHDNYRGAPKDGRPWDSNRCDRRVVRGGSWNDGPQLLRVSYRSWVDPGNRGDDLGFRCAQDR